MVMIPKIFSEVVKLMWCLFLRITFLGTTSKYNFPLNIVDVGNHISMSSLYCVLKCEVIPIESSKSFCNALNTILKVSPLLGSCPQPSVVYHLYAFTNLILARLLQQNPVSPSKFPTFKIYVLLILSRELKTFSRFASSITVLEIVDRKK